MNTDLISQVIDYFVGIYGALSHRGNLISQDDTFNSQGWNQPFYDMCPLELL